MKHTPKLVLFFVLISLLNSCAPRGEDPEQMVTAAKELDQRFLEAYNNGDVDALMDTYWNSPELVSYPPDALVLRGWQNVKVAAEETFKQMKGAKLELTEMNNKAVGDVVLGWGKWRIQMTMPGGEVMTLIGRYSDVKAKRDGKWVYIIDHASVVLPPPPDSADM